ncbi:MFS family permease [Deinobacterium chartae]|uniref:MFS family permease n=1 Tax=Deinobacterium chartae TaxID=521158 RepID=A0A841HVF0_9DEIO|nr:MFS transporter [Deinobacterium chartae]MBB6097471.1 MFS family permease [Deinobacterium chartae]
MRFPLVPLSPLKVYLTLEFTTSLLFALAFTAQAVYFIQTARLDPLQLLLVGAVLEGTCLLLEVPTGVIADAYSRRRSVLLGYALLGSALLVIGAFPVFAAILLAQVIAGAGYTCLSGATTAWLADELGEDHLPAALLRAAQAGRIGGLIGIAACALIASVSLQLPLLLAGLGLLLLSGFLTLTMTEHGFVRPKRSERPGSLRDMRSGLERGLRAVRARPGVLALLLAAAVFGASTEAWDRLWELHLLAHFTLPALPFLGPVAWFALIGAGHQLLSLTLTATLWRHLEAAAQARPDRLLMLLTALGMAAAVLFALAGSFALAIAALWLAGVVRGLYGPVYDAWLNRGLESGSRATVLSLASQADALGQIAFGPLMGLLAKAASVQVALLMVAVLRAPNLWLFARAARPVRPLPGAQD